MFGFTWNKSNKNSLISLPLPSKEELLDLSSLNFDHGLNHAIETAIEKQVNSANFFEFAESIQEGNYFGSEFNIVATSGRIKSTYAKEPWINASASLIAKSLANLKFKVVDSKTGDVIENHPLLMQLNTRNALDDSTSLSWKSDLDLILGGNGYLCFDDKYKSAIVAPCEMSQINIDPITNFPISLTCGNGSGMAVVPWEQVVHFKYPNPYNSYYGLSMFTAASRPILLDRYKNEFEMAFYLRGATNSGIIETTDEVNKSRMERLMKTFEAVYTGRRNWWRTIFLPKGAKWVQSGLKMTEMQHLEGLKENRLTILAVLGIPPAMLGITVDVNRATAEVQERNFWQNCVTPIANFKASAWNNSYLVRQIYKNKIKVVPDFSSVEALQGSLVTKGEQAKSMEGYFLIDEIRKEIYGKDELPEGKGKQFVAEIRGAGQSFIDPSLSLSLPPSVDMATESEQTVVLSAKQAVVDDQQQLEEKLSVRFIKGFDDYQKFVFDIVEEAIRKNANVYTVLNKLQKQLAEKYIGKVDIILVGALERGFSLSEGQAKQLRDNISKKSTFNARDQQAIDALRAEQQKGQRDQLIKRSIENFVGFNKTQTTRIVELIAKNAEDGKSNDQIAAKIRVQYSEKYKGQSNTIARTELLTAVSQGMKWNHEVLKEVFTDIKKQWYHVGDIGSNPNARDEHVGYESLGVVDSDYKYGGQLEYPRDPNGGAEQTINCRCSIVSVIPKESNSNADVILDRV